MFSGNAALQMATVPEADSGSSDVPPFELREGTEDDQALIFATWLKKHRESPDTRLITNKLFFQHQHDLIEKILKSCSVIVACNPDEPRHIYGYAVYEWIGDVFVLHWIHTKYTYRNLGIASAMLNHVNPYCTQKPIACTHANQAYTNNVDRFQLVYDPYLLWRHI